jgi:hypothetical protein
VAGDPDRMDRRRDGALEAKDAKGEMDTLGCDPAMGGKDKFVMAPRTGRGSTDHPRARQSKFPMVRPARRWSSSIAATGPSSTST